MFEVKPAIVNHNKNDLLFTFYAGLFPVTSRGIICVCAVFVRFNKLAFMDATF